MSTSTNTDELAGQLSFSWDSPNNVDGEPAAAANMAVRQVLAALELLKRSMPSAELMLRNASMTEALEQSMLNDPMKWWQESSQLEELTSAFASLEKLERWTVEQLKKYESIG